MSNKIKETIPPMLASNDWDRWLSSCESMLRGEGFRKYDQKFKREDFAYWKIYKNDEGESIYQIGMLFYDFRKYKDSNIHMDKISITYECMLIAEDRIDLTVSKGMTLPEFEIMAATFYKSLESFK